MQVYPISGNRLDAPLRLLTSFLNSGDPASDEFVEWFRGAVEKGDLAVFEARTSDEVVGVLVLARRLSVSIGGRFASIEELYVVPEARRRGVGRALLETVEEWCRAHNVSYVEVEVAESVAEVFYDEVGFGAEDDVRLMSRSYPMQSRNLRGGPA